MRRSVTRRLPRRRTSSTPRGSTPRPSRPRTASTVRETTVSAADLGVLVGTTAAQIAAAVNTGFDLGDKDEGKCGGSLIKLAAKKCQALLLAEGKFVAGLAKDPTGEKRAEKLSKATTKFSEGWAKVLSKGCTPTATEGDTESSVDALRDDVVTNTTVSPNVDDTQYTAIAPVGPIDYQGRAFSPVCMNGSPYQFFVKRGTVNKLLDVLPGRRRLLGAAHLRRCRCATPARRPGDNPNGATSGFVDRTNPEQPVQGLEHRLRVVLQLRHPLRRLGAGLRQRESDEPGARRAPRLPEREGRREVGARTLRESRAGVRHRLERGRVRRVVQRRRSWRACGRRRSSTSWPTPATASSPPTSSTNYVPELELRRQPAGRHPGARRRARPTARASRATPRSSPTSSRTRRWRTTRRRTTAAPAARRASTTSC